MVILRSVLLLISVVGSFISGGDSLAAGLGVPVLLARDGQLFDQNGTQVLLRCVNLSPWLNREPYLLRKHLMALFRSPSELEARLEKLVGPSQAQQFWKDWEERFVTEGDFRRLSSQGFNCVRLPLNHRKISQVQPDGSVILLKQGLLPVDRAVSWAEKHNIYIMLDLHTVPGGQNNLATVSDVPSSDTTPRLWTGKTAQENQRLFVEIWRALARRYAHAASVGGYDVLNEPNLPRGVPKSSLPRLYLQVIDAIRSVDQTRLIILSGDDFARDFSAFSKPQVSNIAYGFHIFEFLNPHWANPSQQKLETFLRVRRDHGVPLWLSEFGEGNLQWQQRIVMLMMRNGIGWAVWPWKRVDLGASRPVMLTIKAPASWDSLANYLIGAPFARRPSVQSATQAMNEMLEAIRSENCVANSELIQILSGSK